MLAFLGLDIMTSGFLLTHNLHKTYDGNGGVPYQALKNVSLSLDQGEFTVLSGPSGSGKTTLLNLIGGLDRPNEGYVSLNGKMISDLDESELAHYRLQKIGFIFQAYNLVPVLTASENIEYVMVLQGVSEHQRKQRIEKVCDILGISNLLQKKPGQMSGGEQQRVAVARAIVSRPELILADEPTANLDSQNGENLMQLMRRLNKLEGISFLISSHDSMVVEHARRTIKLKDGEIVESGSQRGRETTKNTKGHERLKNQGSEE